MKIAVFHNLPAGGAQLVLDQQINHLSKHHQLKIYQLDIDSKKPRWFRDLHTFIALPFKHRALVKEIKKEKFDLCLVHPDKLTQSPYLLRFLKIPSIYYAHEHLRLVYEDQFVFNKSVSFFKKHYELFTRKLRKKIDHTNAKKASLILTNSNFTAKNFKKNYQLNSTVCYPGVDTKLFKPKKITKKQVLFIGSPSFENGWELTKDIDSKIKVIHGKSITREQLINQYQASFCTLCLQSNEPFGLVPLESMACGVPVIAIDQGGYQETVINNQTGYLVKPDSKKIANLLKKLSSRHSLVKKLGIMGRKHVKKNFTWQQHFINLDQQINQLLKK